METRGEFGVGQSLGEQAQDVEFARGEVGEIAVPGGGVGARAGEAFDEAAGGGGRRQRFTAPDRADGGRQVLGRDVLEQKAAGSGGQRRVHVPVEVEGGQHEDARRVGDGEDPAGGLQAVQLGHPDVHQDDVGPGAPYRLHRFVAVGGLRDDVDAVGAEGQPEARAHQRLVVGDHDPGRTRR